MNAPIVPTRALISAVSTVAQPITLDTQPLPLEQVRSTLKGQTLASLTSSSKC